MESNSSVSFSDVILRDPSKGVMLVEDSFGKIEWGIFNVSNKIQEDRWFSRIFKLFWFLSKVCSLKEFIYFLGFTSINFDSVCKVCANLNFSRVSQKNKFVRIDVHFVSVFAT